MKRFLFLISFLLNIISLFAAESPFRFIENKNQWNKNILFKADIPSGALFLEKNCFTYNLLQRTFRNKAHTKKYRDTTGLYLKGHAFKVTFKNANAEPLIASENAYEDYHNFFIGKNPSNWSSRVLSYETISYSDLYNGIDLKIYSKDNSLKYDFSILPGVDPSIIKLKYEGINNISIKDGQLIIETSIVNVIEKAPYAYQIVNGKTIEVPCSFTLSENTVSFSFPRGYNNDYKLIIDPVLIFSTYSGSTADNFGYTATYDSYGFLYSGSSAFGVGYPTTLGAYQQTFKGGTKSYLDGVDFAITKYDTTGKKRIYSTYLGGSSDELPHSLIVDNEDNLLIFGTTSSKDFPVTKGCFDSTFAGDSVINLVNGIGVKYSNGSDIVISKLSNDGSKLLASTYVGGSGNDGLVALSTFDHKQYYPPPYNNYYDSIYRTSPLRYNYADEVRGEVEVDKLNNVYVATCTKSVDFPTISSSFQNSFKGGVMDAVIVKLNSDLTSLIWSTYLGGNKDDAAYSLELDSLNNIYIGGGTNSTDFPVTTGVVYSTQNGGRADGFISCLDSNGSILKYSTYFGSPTYDQVYFVDLDRFNNVYVFGQTMAPGNYFVHNATYSNPGSGQFISKLKPDLSSFIWSTVFGNGSGQPNISPTAFLVDLCNAIYLSGWGGTPENTDFLNMFLGIPGHSFQGMPITPDAFQSNTFDDNDFYLFVLKDDASSVTYGSYIGGSLSPEHVDGGTSRFDRKGKIYQAVCGGCDGNSDFPIKPNPGAVSPTNNSFGGCNCAVFKMDFNLPAVVADFDVQPGCSGSAIQFINKSLEQHLTQYKWHFGDGQTSAIKDPTHTYASGGTYNVTLIALDNVTCNLADTITKTIYISGLPASLSIGATSDQDTIYRGHSTYLHAIPNSGYLYSWNPAGSLNDASSANPKATPDTTTTYYLTVADPKIPTCKQNAAVKIVVTEINCNEPHIYIPNAFTPDGDGKNDIFFVRSNYIENLYFTIYNRWGEKIFETRDQNIGWDGTYNGMKADPGVFDYYLEVTCIDQQKFFKKGNITLIR